MIFPDVIEKVFAETGEKEAPPQLSPNNFVNFETGYTPDYELRLNSNNPQAKAVERRIQNYMLNQLTMNAKAWQSQGLPGWYANKTGGYERNVLVLHVINGVARPYRSLVDQNLATPGSDSSRWEYQQTMAEMISNIPMPAGGSAGSSAFLITTGGAAFNPTALTTGSYFFATDAAAQATTGLPITKDGSVAERRAGLLEVLANQTIRLSRYTDRLGNQFVWVSGSTGSSGWRQLVDYRVMQSGAQTFAFANAVGNSDDFSVDISPAPGDLYQGMRIWVRFGKENSGRVRINLNATGPKEVICSDFYGLEGGEIGPNLVYELTYSRDFEYWFMTSPGFIQRGRDARFDGQLPNLGQVKRLLGANPSMCGAIQMFAHENPGPEWIRCDGRAVPRAGLTANLFLAIGTNFGGGDGSTTFNVPDLRGSFVRDVDARGSANGGRDPDARSIGSLQLSANLLHRHTGFAEQAGAHSHSLSIEQSGNHNHTGNALYGGGHYHNVVGVTLASGNHNHTVSGGTGQAGVHGHTVSGNTNEAGLHTHTIWKGNSSSNTQTGGVGFDNPSFNGETDAKGTHSHAISGNTNQSGSHSHDFSGSSDVSGNHIHDIAGSTTTAYELGAHSHSISTDSAGLHSHTGSAATSGLHIHSVNTDDTGGAESRPVNIALPHFIHI